MAQLDPTIAGGVKPIQIEDPISQMAKYQDVAVNALKMQEYQRGVEEQNALRDLRKSGISPKSQEYISKAYEISPKLGMELEKSQLETRKLSSQVTKEDLDVAQKQYSNLAFNPSNENVLAHLQDAMLSGRITKQAAEQQWQKIGVMNEKQRAQYFTQLGMGVKDYMTFKETERTHKAHEGIAGGNLALARQRFEYDKTKPQFVAEAGGYVVPPSAATGGEARVIPVEGLKTKASQAQESAAYNTKLILNAAKDISAAVKAEPEAKKPGFKEAIVGSIPGVRGAVGATQSAQRQIVAGAQEQMLDAILYLATGAAYNKEQRAGQIAALLPGYLDEPANIAAKQARLRETIMAAKDRAGKLWTPEMDAAVQKLFERPEDSSRIKTNPNVVKDFTGGGKDGAVRTLDEIFNDRK